MADNHNVAVRVSIREGMDEPIPPSHSFDSDPAVLEIHQAMAEVRTAFDALESALARLGQTRVPSPVTELPAAPSRGSARASRSPSIVGEVEAGSEAGPAEATLEANEVSSPEIEQEAPEASLASSEGEAEADGKASALVAAEPEATGADEVSSESEGVEPSSGVEEEQAVATAEADSPPTDEDEAPEAVEEVRPRLAEQPLSAAWSQWSTPDLVRDGAWPSPTQSSEAQEATAAPAEAEAAETPESLEGGPEPEDADVREQVRRAVEQLKAELGSSLSAYELGVQAEDAASPEDDAWDEPQGSSQILAALADDSQTDDVREQVRQAVLKARAELRSGLAHGEQGDALDADQAAKSRLPHFESLPDELLFAPASLIIDDPEGRVELVRVYRTLARLDCAATANLANYSSHSVTVQMEERNLPAEQEIASAIQYAFERECTVDVTGNRATIRLSGGKMQAA